MSFKVKTLLVDFLSYIVLGFGALIVVYPLIWMIEASFKQGSEFYVNPWGFPQRLLWENYKFAWQRGELLLGFFNSVTVTCLSVLFICILSFLASYAFARMEFPGREVLYYSFLLSMIVPAQIQILPLFVILKNLGAINRLIGLIISHTSGGIAFSIFLLRAFLSSIPRELEEAAFVEGCSRFRVLTTIILPLSKPGLSTVIIFQGMGIWNDFFTSLILANSPKVRTLPLRIYFFMTQYVIDWSYVFATLTIVALPIIVLYFILQTQFISGLTAGALKG